MYGMLENFIFGNFGNFFSEIHFIQIQKKILLSIFKNILRKKERSFTNIYSKIIAFLKM